MYNVDFFFCSIIHCLKFKVLLCGLHFDKQQLFKLLIFKLLILNGQSAMTIWLKDSPCIIKVNSESTKHRDHNLKRTRGSFSVPFLLTSWNYITFWFKIWYLYFLTNRGVILKMICFRTSLVFWQFFSWPFWWICSKFYVYDLEKYVPGG